MKASKLIQEIVNLCNHHGVDLNDVNVNLRENYDTDVCDINEVCEDLYDEVTNKILTDIVLMECTKEEPSPFKRALRSPLKMLQDTNKREKNEKRYKEKNNIY
tara:strand:- start:461 stop:769 length:309 start_codon:yes stop_codon:yes gene_type:complete